MKFKTLRSKIGKEPWCQWWHGLKMRPLLTVGGQDLSNVVASHPYCWDHLIIARLLTKELFIEPRMLADFISPPSVCLYRL